MQKITYEVLFDFLLRIGFVDTSSSNVERVFEHPEMGIVLAFSMMGDTSVERPVRDADLTSVEVKLHHYGLIGGSVVAAVSRYDAST